MKNRRTYTVVKLGVKYAGPCVKCGTRTGERPFELEKTILLKGEDMTYAVAHAACLGVRVRHRVQGGVAANLPSEITVE